MKQIRIRDLHIKTGEWVRKAARGEGVVITERGRPMASLIPFKVSRRDRFFHWIPACAGMTEGAQEGRTRRSAGRTSGGE